MERPFGTASLCARGLAAQTKGPSSREQGPRFREMGAGSAYRSRKRVNVKVLDFVKRGAPKCTVLRTFRWEVRI